jgi:hypothetical protein
MSSNPVRRALALLVAASLGAVALSLLATS